MIRTLLRSNRVICNCAFALTIIALQSLPTHAVFPQVNGDGSLSNRIEIKIPAGAKGMNPQLALEYNSHAGNGIAGMGWQLSGLAAIKRVSYNSAINFSASDSYAESSAGILIDQGGGTYFPKVETFTKFAAIGSCGNGPCSWTAQDRSGVTKYYGSTSDSRIEAVGKGGSVRVWALSRVEDRNGNAYTISYNEDSAQGSYYPATITYTIGPGISAYRTVEFAYENRSDTSESYTDSALEFVDQRLKWVAVKSSGVLTRKYRLDYDVAPATGRSRLTGVQEIGSDGSTALPASTFSWQDGGNGQCAQGYTCTEQSGFNSNYSTFMVDVNGDGKVDMVKTLASGQVCVNMGLGNGYFQTPYVCTEQTGFNAQYSTFVADVNGDSKADVVRTLGTGQVCVNLGLGNGHFQTPYMCTEQTGFNENYATFMVDVNNDGKADLVKTLDSGQVCVNLSLGNGYFRDPYVCTEQGGFNSNYQTQLVDVNGDGQVDMVKLLSSGQACVNLGLGNGYFQTPYRCTEQTGFNDQYATHLADVNGDGRIDMIKTAPSGQACVNLGLGNGYFQTPYNCTDTGGFNSQYTTFIVDTNGDGIMDIARTEPGGQVCVNLGIGQTADLMTSMSNGLGSVTAVSYAAAPQVSGAVRADLTSPGNANSSPRPLVMALSTTDGRGGSFITSYAYANGRYMPGTADVQTDLGFASVTRLNNNTGEQQITVFHQAAPFHGRPLSVTNYAGNAALVGHLSYVYDSVSPNSGTTFVRETSETNATYNLGTVAYTTTRTISYDGYGNQTVNVESGGGMPDVTTTTTYNVDTSNWTLGSPTSINVSSGGGTLKQTTITYSGPNATQVCAWIGVSGNSCTSFGYDAGGNPTSMTDALGHTTSITYDSVYNAQVATTTNALGHVTAKTYGADGQVTSETSANGDVTTYSYDVFGRRAQTDLPNGGRITYDTQNLGNPNAQYTLTTTKTDGSRTSARAQFFDGMGYVYKETVTGDTGTIQTLSTKDAAGRTYSISQPHYVGGNPDWTTRTFDPAGRVTTENLPNGTAVYYSYGSGSVTKTDTNGRTETKHFNALGKVTSIADAAGNTTYYTLDGLGRVTHVTLADGSATTIVYDGLGNKTSITEPNTGTTTFSYNSAGQMVSQTNARSQTTSLTYDVLGRVTAKHFPAGGGTDVAYRYDETGVAGGIGRLTSQTDEGGDTSYSYDAMGQILTKQMIVDGKSYTYTTTYDYAKRPAQVTYPDGSVVDYAYTDGGNLSTVGLNGTNYAVWTNYNAAGNPGNLGLANGTATTYTYGTLGKLASLVTSAPGGQIQNLAYTFDNGTNVTAITDNRSNKIDASTLMDTDETVSYTYDNLDRMTAATGVWGTLNYTYNSTGNLTGHEGRSINYTGHRATSGTNFAATYDATGNMLSQTLDGVSWGYDYDAENRISKVHKAGSTVALMSYDDGGQRVKKVYNRPDSSQVTTIYIGTGYEVRKRDGTEFYTINLHGNGQLIASITRQGPITTAMGEFRRQLALTNRYSSHTLAGLFMKASQYFSAAVSHPQTAPRIAYAFSIAMLLCVLGLLILTIARELGWMGNKDEQGLPVGMRIMALSTILLFTQTNCGALGGGGGGDHFAFWPFGGGLYHVPLKEALTGDTLNGLPLGTYFYHKNQVNSSTVITDATGVEATRIIYKPFGTIDQSHSPGSDTVTHKFTGQEFDEESGLYYYNARYYSAAIGRFVTADSMVPGNGEDPQGFNRYAYVRNNPVKYTDPTGHVWNVIAAMAGGLQWAAAGIAGGAAWASASMGNAAMAVARAGNWRNYTAANAAGGISWAADSIRGGFSSAGMRESADKLMRAAQDTLRRADHSARGILKNIDQGSRRIGETWEELRGNRHPNHEQTEVAPNPLSPYNSWYGRGNYVYQTYLDLVGQRAYSINKVALFVIAGAAGMSADTPEHGVFLFAFLWFGGPAIINAGKLNSYNLGLW